MTFVVLAAATEGDVNADAGASLSFLTQILSKGSQTNITLLIFLLSFGIFMLITNYSRLSEPSN